MRGGQRLLRVIGLHPLESLTVMPALGRPMTSDDGLPGDDKLGHGGPVAQPPVSERSLEPIGVAQRWACADQRELWRLPPSHQRAADELLVLGRAGIGGFIEGGPDPSDGRPWLVRAQIETKLPALLGTHEGLPLSWRPVVGLVADLARALAAAESRGLFPGLLRPTNVVIEPSVWVLADALVHARVDAPSDPSPTAELRREWLTPAAAAGQPDDASSNRWLLGLLLYRLLCGRGPFAGLGLRSAIDRASQGVPPLPDVIARELPPGLQGLILRILAPAPEQRVSDAATIHAELTGFLREGAPADPNPNTTLSFVPPRAPAAASPQPDPPPIAANVSATPRPRRSGRSVVRRILRASAVVGVVCLGVIGGGVLLDLAGDPQPEPQIETTPKPKIGSRAPLDAAHTSPEDCASCHPRQTAEWKRSVMGHSAKSPLFQALEILIQEQAGRSDDCPGGAGVLRTQDPRTACRDPDTNIAITGSGGELWCANCHTPRENLGAVLPAWDGLALNSSTRRPLRDLQPASTTEGIDCGFCHQVHGPVRPGSERAGFYEGNPSWLSTVTGQTFEMRPEDRVGQAGIANSGYILDPAELIAGAPGRPDAPLVPGGVHRRPSDDARAYLRSSQFCGACHDVRLFGTDAIAGPNRGEHFRRLRNAYSEWADWASLERRAGRDAADCQDCHMSSFPGVCVSGDPPAPVAGEPDIVALRNGCPPGTHFESRNPGELPHLRVAAGSGEPSDVSTHYFSGVDIPLTPEFDDHYIDQPELDAAGIPLGGDQRRDLLLGRSFRFELGEPVLVPGGRKLEVPVVIENTGAGHKIPAGFSQEREFWVHLRITDAEGRVVYEVGRVDRGDEDLRDKLFVSVNVSDRIVNQQGQPLGMFGADVRDGPDVPQWQSLDGGGEFDPATRFRGRGLINLQNGFLRCVKCIGFIDRAGRCLPRDASQELHRAARFDDAPFDIDTGECQSNLFGEESLFEIYFPVGSLDATRGVVKGPDAIIDLRSAPPGVPMQWTYDLPISSFKAPFEIEAQLLFRSFPPFLIKAFADYETRQAAAGLRPSGPLVTREMLSKLEVVEIATHTRTVAAP
ncbi:hypothetical protein [Enhygromyxa salina]|uniref:Serine/threonine-protein kinase PknB n=1 Tax=Enhygromyxa salina TaxID=215803 RepID=A0A2S9Y686_9BACT|nr:hypothetical protein [Enhygromyxa salina]PRQ00602.1 Serine/threonine-protein kinase PknB [Enhygromyxa salina]